MFQKDLNEKSKNIILVKYVQLGGNLKYCVAFTFILDDNDPLRFKAKPSNLVSKVR